MQKSGELEAVSEQLLLRKWQRIWPVLPKWTSAIYVGNRTIAWTKETVKHSSISKTDFEYRTSELRTKIVSLS